MKCCLQNSTLLFIDLSSEQGGTHQPDEPYFFGLRPDLRFGFGSFIQLPMVSGLTSQHPGILDISSPIACL
jgi:hypothetical protein